MPHACNPRPWRGIAACEACILLALNATALSRRHHRSAIELGVNRVTNVRANEMWLEFGVWRGGSTRKLAAARRRKDPSGVVHGFDSFRGLPETWRDPLDSSASANEQANAWLRQGSFNLDGVPPFTQAGIEWVIGWFNETLPSFLRHHDGPISLVHVDSDLYSSAASVLALIEQRLVPQVSHARRARLQAKDRYHAC